MLSLNETQFFKYPFLIKPAWATEIKKAQKQFNVYFDLENNDLLGKEQRVIKISETTFRCELWQAGGDWENPVNYFKCQLYRGNAVKRLDAPSDSYWSEFSNNMMVFIPNKDQGNFHLIKTEKNTWRSPNQDDSKEIRDIEPSKNKSWKSLKEYLTKLVNKYNNNRKVVDLSK